MCSMNNRQGDITAIIPVRSGSERCPNKNTRSFGDSNLLKMKIDLLKTVPEISKIVVSSSDENMLFIAREAGVHLHVRDPIFSTSRTTGSEVFKCLADSIDTPVMMYVHCVAPFVQARTYSAMIAAYRERHEYDSVVSCKNIKEFLWMNSAPINYCASDHPQSQLLPDVFAPSFGANILQTNLARELRSIIGMKPLFFQLSQLEGIDIDTPFDFITAKLLHDNFFLEDSDLNRSAFAPARKTLLLDCTIRDGGYENKWNFSLKDVQNCYRAVSLAGFDYCEIGFLHNIPEPGCGCWWSCTQENIDDVKGSVVNGCKLAVMIAAENIGLCSYKLSNLTMIRVMLNYSRFRNSLQILRGEIDRLISLGYEVTLNLANADKLSMYDIRTLTCAFADCSIMCTYIADSCGNLQPHTLRGLLKLFNRISPVPLGFHGHNNIGQAYANAKVAIDEHVLLLDSTVGGLGRGGGNLKSELVVCEKPSNRDLQIEPLLKFGEDVVAQFQINYKLSTLHMISGWFGCHPEYAHRLSRETLTSSIDQYHILKNISSLCAAQKMCEFRSEILATACAMAEHALREA